MSDVLAAVLPSLIIFGGGWGAEGTQASIEAHAGALEAALRSRAPVLLFASGDPNVRDVQIPAATADEPGELLGLIFDRGDNLDVAYRASRLPKHGTASKNALLDAIEATKNDARGTIVLGVGHGNNAPEDEHTSIELWGPDDRLTAGELAKHLDGHRRKGPIAFALGHCHSGGFVDIAREEGDEKAALAEPARCVVAAVPREREASGCTPDIGDPDARSYMAVFAEAIHDTQHSDLDKDGHVSVAEAHTFARVQDKTVDVPVSTTEMYIKAALGTRAPQPAAIRELPKLLSRTRATERKVIEELAPKGTPKQVHDELQSLEDRIQRLGEELEDLDEDRDRVRRRILDVVLTRWPELANPYHAESRKLRAESDEVVKLIRGRKELGELRERDLSIRAKEHEKFEAEKRAARLERWLRAVELAAGEDALRKSKNKKAIAELDRLIACEAMILF